MEDFDNFFDSPDIHSFDRPESDLSSPASNHTADHASFFADYEVDGGDDDSKIEESRADSAMDMDEDQSSSGRLQGDEDEQLAHDLASRFRSYNLRPTSVRDGKAVWITWLDTDDSGNYDPQKPDTEMRTGRSSRSSSSARRRRSRSGSVQHSRDYMSDNDLDDERRPAPTAKYLSELAARQQGVSLTITFDLTTNALQNLAASIPDHWPGEDHNVLSDEHFRFLADQLNNRNNGWKSYNLRRRDSAISEDVELEEGLWLPDNRIEDPLGVELDLRNHPAARGCKGCRELGEICSLLADGTDWPCMTCLADSCDCELITPPERRLACEHCQRKRLRCSYVTDESDPSLPCSECATQGFVCVAGPHPDYVYQRIDYCKVRNKSPEPVLHDRKYTTCTECRSQKKSCSLKTRFDYPPCESCKHDGLECTFLPLSRKQSTNNLKKAPKKKNLAPGQRHIITTALNHPVHFLHENEAECAWCMQNIGVVGRGMRDITVVAAADGLSYREIAGGENASGRQNDHMCMVCTLERSRIIGCGEHELRPIEGINIDAINVAAMLERIAERSKPVPTDLWCAVCPAPALYQCCTLQTHDKFGQLITDPRSKEANGCSLLLCEDCAVSYGEFQNLDRVIDAARDEPEIWVLGQRADAEFLKQDGLLVKNMMVGFEGDDMDVDG